MSFGVFGPLKVTLLTRFFQRQLFATVNPNSGAERSLSLKYGSYVASTFCARRLQHSSKQVDITETKLSDGQARVSNEGQINKEGTIKKTANQISPSFPLKQLTKSAQIFETFAVSSLNEQGFSEAINTFKKRDVKRLKVMDFISTAVNYMETFGATKTVDSYNQLLDLFPKGQYHNRTVFDTLWTRYRPQIDCAVQVLTKLEENGVRPNVDTYDIVHAIFGNDSIPLNKLRRIVFWFDKFDEMYPDPLPKELPSDKQDLFKIAINQINGEKCRVSVISCKNSDGIVHQIIASENKNLSNSLAEYDITKPVFCEGPHIMWLRKTRISYYVLKADFSPNVLDEDHILGICILEENKAETELKQWIKELQKNFPRLAELNIIFNINSNTDKL